MKCSTVSLYDSLLEYTVYMFSIFGISGELWDGLVTWQVHRDLWWEDHEAAEA